MTDIDKNTFYNLLDKNLDSIEEIVNIVRNSIETVDSFLSEHSEIVEKYHSLVQVESYCNRYNLWDEGFLVIRKNGEEYMKVFNWFFSVVKIADKDNVALLMTELLDPQCKTTKDIRKIKNFLKINIKDFVEKSDCVLISDISENVDFETGTEISKEKSIEIILQNFNKH